MSWNKFSEHIRSRNIEGVKNRWSHYFDGVDAVSLSDVVDDLMLHEHIDAESPTAKVLSITNIVPNAYVELRSMEKKLNASTHAPNILFEKGALSWASVDYYNIHIIALKLFCACYGVFLVSSNGKQFLIDVFASLEDDNDLSPAVDRINVRILSYKGQKIEHKHLSSIARRIYSLAKISDYKSEIDFVKSNLTKRNLNSVRHNMIYGNTFWTKLDSMDSPPTEENINIQAIKALPIIDRSWLKGEEFDIMWGRLVSNLSSKLFRYIHDSPHPTRL